MLARTARAIKRTSTSVAVRASVNGTQNVLSSSLARELMPASLALCSSVEVTVNAPTRSMSTAPTVDYEALRTKFNTDIESKNEALQANNFRAFLSKVTARHNGESDDRLKTANLSREQLMQLVTAAMATFAVHVESRAAAVIGQGFYTIGPCGEELMAAAALAMRPTDAVALHYRHVGIQLMRQLMSGKGLDSILLDRARGHTVSSLDPVTGGAHCAIGGGPYDFLVTSTLASQACPAVGRAIGSRLAEYISKLSPNFVPHFSRDMVSFVSVGDGSVNNAHFLSAVNLAEYAMHRSFKCPVVFVVTDNDLCISLRGYDYVKKQWLRKLQMPFFSAHGDDFLSIYTAHSAAAEQARTSGKPALVYVGNIKRRFGHAATDRQNAYLTAAEIKALAEHNPLEPFVQELVDGGVFTSNELVALWDSLQSKIRASFSKAATEPKITKRAASLAKNAVPLAPLPDNATRFDEDPTKTHLHSYVTSPASVPNTPNDTVQSVISRKMGVPYPVNVPPKSAPDVMRKHMTAVFDELMTAYPHMVYIGEDVRHGGYYLVTDGLADKYKDRVRDFPPDETSLIGVGMGFAQAGLVPIVEIPYAKYLDCGADMFFEAALMHWLSNGKQPNGMIVRLQGFGKGVFGGNFHTHNSLHMPPGIDVVCYSNGTDYARGMRYAALQASRGRIVMSVDSTHLLNMNHVEEGDRAWRTPYTKETEYMDFDQVRVYEPNQPNLTKDRRRQLAIVTYGEGVITSLQARKMMADSLGVNDVTIIDCPLLSGVPAGLKQEIVKYDAVLFADPCKEGQHPLSTHVTRLQREGLLPTAWRTVTAQHCYNPLGNTTTFLSANDIKWEGLRVVDPRRAAGYAAEEEAERA